MVTMDKNLNNLQTPLKNSIFNYNSKGLHEGLYKKNKLSLCWIAVQINHSSRPLCSNNQSHKSDSLWELRVCG